MTDNETRANALLAAGFPLLISGIALGVISGDNRFFQVLQILLIVAAAAVFGASIGARRSSGHSGR